MRRLSTGSHFVFGLSADLDVVGQVSPVFCAAAHVREPVSPPSKFSAAAWPDRPC
jgi:hypothetical protein